MVSLRDGHRLAVVLVMALLFALSACSSPSQESVGNRSTTYESASFSDLQYHAVFDGEAVFFNVSVLAFSSYDEPTVSPQVANETLTLVIGDAGEDPRVKPALFATAVTGHVPAERAPRRLRIVGEAGSKNDSVVLDWSVRDRE